MFRAEHRTRLLVSVFAADEVGAALSGGADVVDVKDPAAGALGPPRPDVLRAVSRELAGRADLSVALGDCAPGDLRALAEAIACGAAFVKVGLLGAPQAEQAVARLWRLRARAPGARVAAVTFPDTAASLPVEDLPRVAHAAGASIVMLDTRKKDGRSSLDHLGADGVAAFVRAARSLGLGVALAGALGEDDVERAAGLGADVVGVRGAACDGGRGGRVSALRVAALRLRLSAGADGSRPSPGR